MTMHQRLHGGSSWASMYLSCNLHGCWLWVPLPTSLPLCPHLLSSVPQSLYSSHTGLPCCFWNVPDKSSMSGPFQSDFLCLICCPSHNLKALSLTLSALLSLPSVAFYCHWYHLTAYIVLLFWELGFHASPTALHMPVLGSHQLSPNLKWLPLSQIQCCQICASLLDLVARKCREFCHLSLASAQNLGHAFSL